MTKLKSLLKREQEINLKIQEEIFNLHKMYHNKLLTKVIYNRLTSLRSFRNVSFKLRDYEEIDSWEQIKQDIKEYKQIPIITDIYISDNRNNRCSFNCIAITVQIRWE